MLVAVVSDTHIPHRAKSLPVAAWQAIKDADLVLHAGDVCVAGVLEELAGLAPTHAVTGNMDPDEVREWGATDTLELTLDGVRVAMVHDSGAREGRARRLRRWFPEADVVIFGHSHLPLIEHDEGLLLLNPGSPTDRRRAPGHTVALLRLEDGRAEAEIVPID